MVLIPYMLRVLMELEYLEPYLLLRICLRLKAWVEKHWYCSLWVLKEVPCRRRLHLLWPFQLMRFNHLGDWFLRFLHLGSRRVARSFWALKLDWRVLMLLNIGGLASPAG